MLVLKIKKRSDGERVYVLEKDMYVCVCVCVCMYGCVSTNVNVKTFVHYFINIVKTSRMSRPEYQDRAKMISNVSKHKLTKFGHWS